MTSQPVAAVLDRATGPACAWCETTLVSMAQAWWCPQPACSRRQLAYATYRQDASGKVLDYLYVPSPSQTTWHEAVYQSRYRRILCGGAAGPGKSRMLREALYLLAQQVPGFHGLLLRRTFKDLEQSHLRFMPHEVEQRGGTWKQTERVAAFPQQDSADSLIRCGHMETDGDIENYLSAEYDCICPDELVTFNRDVMLELFTRARTTNPAMSALRGNATEDYDGALVLAASNPGGRGGAWVKDFFIDRCPDPDEFPHYRPEHWAFFPAFLKDNPYIKTGGYEQSLSALRESRKRQLLDGDWTVYEGQVFDDFRLATHVRDLGCPSADCPRFLSLDWGRNAPGVCLWWVALPDGHYHIEAEFKFNGGVAHKMTVKDVALEIRRRCTDLGLKKVPTCWTDPACWSGATAAGVVGESIAEAFLRWKIPVAKAANERVNGWQRLHELFRIAPDGQPWLTISPTCTYGIRTIPMQMQSRTNPEDIDTNGDDHWVDAARYGTVSGVRWGAQQHKAPPAYGTAAWWRTVHAPAPPGLLGSESCRAA